MSTEDDGIAAFIEALRPVKVTRDGNYKPIDRFRDFRAAFGTESGQRVLSQIIDYCEGRPASEQDVADHARLAFWAGRRRAGQWIAATATIPPPEQDPA